MPNMMPPPYQNRPDKIGVAIVYWGRQGAGAILMAEIAQAMSADERFTVFASPSRQSELPNPLDADRLFPIDTFSGIGSLALRTIVLPVVVSRLVQRLAAARVQAIVTIMPHVWGLALQRAAKRAGIHTLLIVHDADPHPGERRPVFDWLVRREIRGSDRIVTFSNHVADRLVARGDIAPEHLTRLYHPTFEFGSPKRQDWTGRSPFRLLFFGRILPYKGVPLLLDAFAHLRAAGVDCTLRVVGRGKIDATQSLIRQPGLSIEQGWVKPEAIADILAAADAIVLPYIESSQSGVIAAAYGAGLPVVVTPVGGLVEQVVDGTTGTIAGAVTAADLAAAIRRLIDTPGLYETCRAGAVAQADAQSPRHFARALGDAIALEMARPARQTG
jgi:glycosyltransferase involved in cell wall biosynthesis